ncbi:S1C family serine protease [Caldimonas caldifontis]|uniref:Serine protease n=1 Tax=Caldimonas caldifontis TaxID=1452508 RepID=A0A2S5SZ71_9BURK|nr:S1C family serine protease [Caldimonas caldifontis]PPE68051.1 serine protease [Caldimonas caldifontis]
MRALPRPSLWGLTLAAATLLALATATRAQTPPNAEAASVAGSPAQIAALERARDAVVGLRIRVARDARSAASLGTVREGSGVVIGNDDLVLTIGYLVLEAERVDVRTGAGRTLPARVLAYDLATGFGLVQPLVPLGVTAAPLGRSTGTPADEPYMIVSGGDDGGISLAQLVSQRAFSGYWEYHIEGALFTSPPRTDHSGAALFNARGELVGIGSLLLSDTGAGTRRPGNMFVPVDLLKPVMAELRERGASRQSTRAWLGLNCVEAGGAVQVMRVTEESPAEEAGLAPGDRILSIDGTAVQNLEGLYKRLWEGGPPEREVTLEVARGPVVRTVKVQSMDRMKHLRGAQGI